MLFNFKTLNARLLVAFGSIIALIILFVGYNFYVNSQMESKSKELIEKQLDMVMTSQQVAASITVRAAASTNYIVTGQSSYLDIFQTYSDMADENNDKLLKLDPASAEKRQEVMAQAAAWREAIQEQVFAVQNAGNTELAVENLKKLNDEATVVRKQYDELATASANEIEDLGTDVIQSTESSKTTGLILGAIILVLGIVIAIYTSSNISKPVRLVSERMSRVADGNLSDDPIEMKRQDEVGGLVTSVNSMSLQMSTILKSIHQVSEQVASNSEELAQSAVEVNNGTSQIAHSMQELSDGIESQAVRANELADTVQSFKGDVEQMSVTGGEMVNNTTKMQSMTESGMKLMNSSYEQMLTIHEIMEQSVSKVEDLKVKSDEINTLVVVIRDIANQTNLLALNAAIEAARAGEHGKGFAVVADEVRKLAEQVQLSIKDISSIVDSIQSETNAVTVSLQHGYDEVQKGTHQIEETNTTFEQLIHAINEVSSNMNSISQVITDFEKNTDQIHTTIQEVAALSEEASMAVHETTSTIQQTASTVEEIARSNEELALTAEKLNSEINHFKL
jgi:methyl-accepting chemotaxis protein